MPARIHQRARHILANNPELAEGAAWGIATNQIKKHEGKTVEKRAFVESLPTLAGLSVGYSPGRSVAGETAAAIAPQGRVHRSENIARNAAVIGAPLGGLVAMGLARKNKIAPRLAEFVGKNFPEGLIAEPAIEQELVNLGVPGVAAITGSLAGGGVTGGLVGGAQRLRGPTHHREPAVKEAALKPSPMWGTIGGAAKQPAWRAQAGFTPTGMSTPAQKLQKSMGMAKFDPNKGLKPLDLGKMQQQAQGAAMGEKMGHAMYTLTKNATEDEKKEKVPGAGVKFLGGQALGTGGTLGTVPLFGSMARNAELEAEASGAKELASKVEATSPVTIHKAQGVVGGQFMPGGQDDALATHRAWGLHDTSKEESLKPHIVIPNSKTTPSTLAHEIGHANIDKSRLGRIIQNAPVARFSNLYKNPAAMALGIATGASDDEHIRNAGLVGAGLMSAPQLAYEAGANISGYRSLKRLGANPEQLRLARKTLIPAMGTYGLSALATLGSGMSGSGIGRGLRNIGREKPVKEKTADDGGVHGGFSVSQYSGLMNPLPLNYVSGIPSWREPPVKTVPRKKEAMAGMTTLSRLNSAKRVGAPKLSTPPGPSIAQISKPTGYGKPISGAAKGNHII